MRPPELVVAEDDAGFAETACRRIAEQINAAVAHAGDRGRCTLALAGGSTPRPVYECLAHSECAGNIPWDKLELYFSDERCVPPDHLQSNYRMVSESLLHGSPIRSEQVHRIPGEQTDPDTAAAEYEKLLPRKLDLLLLGMGLEGHTASLFPDSPALDERARRVVAVEVPAQPPGRITITPPVIENAWSVFVLISGGAKAAMVARAIREPFHPRKIPVQLALRGVWILDRAASEHTE